MLLSGTGRSSGRCGPTSARRNFRIWPDGLRSIHRMDGWVNDEPMTPQQGCFYGGWITSRVEGPFKAIPITLSSSDPISSVQLRSRSGQVTERLARTTTKKGSPLPPSRPMTPAARVCSADLGFRPSWYQHLGHIGGVRGRPWSTPEALVKNIRLLNATIGVPFARVMRSSSMAVSGCCRYCQPATIRVASHWHRRAADVDPC